MVIFQCSKKITSCSNHEADYNTLVIDSKEFSDESLEDFSVLWSPQQTYHIPDSLFSGIIKLVFIFNEDTPPSIYFLKSTDHYPYTEIPLYKSDWSDVPKPTITKGKEDDLDLTNFTLEDSKDLSFEKAQERELSIWAH